MRLLQARAAGRAECHGPDTAPVLRVADTVRRTFRRRAHVRWLGTTIPARVPSAPVIFPPGWPASGLGWLSRASSESRSASQIPTVLQKIIAERRDLVQTRLVTDDLHDRFEPGLGSGTQRPWRRRVPRHAASVAHQDRIARRLAIGR